MPVVRKNFMYCESEEGGMQQHFAQNFEGLKHLLGWMNKDCLKEDMALRRWMEVAEVGEFYDHRLGVCVRIRDAKL